MMMTVLQTVVGITGSVTIIWLLVLVGRRLQQRLEQRRERIAIKRWKQHHDYDREPRDP